MDDKIMQQILGMVIPEEILSDFEIERIEEHEEERIFHMVEKENRRPEAEEEVLKDGYMRPKDIVHYPSGMKRCTIRLKRRRWVSKADRSRCYYNRYSYTEDGCKAARQFASFLKEIDGKIRPGGCSCRAVGLDLQSRPIEYKDFQSAKVKNKTDLNLRPIYHQTDDNSDAHVFLGLLSYWIFNTVRVQLKRKGENCYWTEIVHRMSTQKLVTTSALNPFDEVVETRICSLPTKVASGIYDKLGNRHYPFRKMKICSTQTLSPDKSIL